jgi:small redox-active disulfide protein 2
MEATMKVQILGGGCPNCAALAANAVEAADRLGIEVEIEKITDGDEIMETGVLRTPGYGIDGVLQDSGRVFSVDEIAESMKKVQK